MWVSKKEYRELIETAATANATAIGLTTQLNTMARELADARHTLTGKPQHVPVFMYQRTATPKTPPGLETGVDFNDMGDEAAHVAGFKDE